MRVLVQRVNKASVHINNEFIAGIDKGLLLLVGFHKDDEESKLNWMAEKILNLRIFSDEAGKMNLDLSQAQGSLLIVSQFTLYGNVNGGRRPDFLESMKPNEATCLYEKFIQLMKAKGTKVETGKFGADMQIHLVNDGPVTFFIEK